MEKKLTRRELLKTGLAAAAGFTIVPRHVLGGPGYTPPSEQITRAIIGTGGMGRGHISYDIGPLLAVCDTDQNHLNLAMEMAAEKGYQNVKPYRDFREILERRDIDLVHIPVPPHWHAAIGIAAANSGKDIWGEKPMTRTIGEGLKLVDAVQRNQRLFRVNTWWRFKDNYIGLGAPIKTVKKMIMNDMLGHPIKVYLGEIHDFEWKTYMWSGIPGLPEQPVPPELDYDMWLGPAPYKPYHVDRVHMKFRGYWDYDGGGLGDQAQHYVDPVQYALGKDDTSPVEAEADCFEQHPDAVQPFRKVWMRYADGCEVTIDAQMGDPMTPMFAGPKGNIWPGRPGVDSSLRCDIPDWEKKLAQLPDPEPMNTDWKECIRNRQIFALNEQVAHRSCTMINLGKIALQTGRRLRFDPDKYRFIDDEQANALIDQPMRAPWQI
ncbi:MAG: Gfo/Idh/MocA family oxidoreductase [Candidatus Sumerlaeaceae bacterium]